MKSLLALLARHPWLYVVFAFAALIAAWTTFISLAVKYSPQQIEVKRER